MPDWTLHTDSESFPLATLGHEKPQFRFSNSKADRCRIRLMDKELDASGLLEFGTPVSISRGDLTWFRGTITQTPRYGDAGTEALEYEISGPWHQLEQLVYQQRWQVADDPNDEESSTTPTYLGRIILTQELDGTKTTVSEQLQDILQFAIDSGVNLAIGTLNVDLTVPWEEFVDLSCADAIREVIKWAPDTVCWFDYSTQTPVLHINRAVHLNATTLTLPSAAIPEDQSAPIESVRLNPRHDLQISEVYLQYVFDNKSNDFSWREVYSDAYPPGATGRQVRALCKTLELRGAQYRHKRTVLKQDVTSISLGDINTLAFWQTYFPQLENVNAQDITITNATRVGTDLTLDRILQKGSITDWMEEQHELKAEVQRVKCRIGPFKRVIQGKVTDETIHYDLETELTLTNASSKTYRYVSNESSSGTPAEALPVGMAQALYEILNPLQWEGEIALVEQEVSGILRPGMVVNLSGGRSEWETMRAIVHEVEESLEDGRTRARLGPAERLSAEGMLALLRLDQNPLKRKGSGKRAVARIGGEDEEDEEQGLGKYHPSGLGSIPGTPQYSRFVIQEPNQAGDDYYRSMVLDAADLIDTTTVPEDILCQMREVPVAAVDDQGNAVLRYAAVLISEPYQKP